MYTISKDPDGIVLVCHECSHVERIDAFDKSVGSQRTQAARAMQIHSREQHGLGSMRFLHVSFGCHPKARSLRLKRGAALMLKGRLRVLWRARRIGS
jgi:hypothetical protein